MNTCRYPNAFVSGRRRMMRDAASSDILAVWKRAAPRNRMREIFTSGSVGGLAEQSLALPGRVSCEVEQHLPASSRGVMLAFYSNMRLRLG
jgi:hypothetical protein